MTSLNLHAVRKLQLVAVALSRSIVQSHHNYHAVIICHIFCSFLEEICLDLFLCIYIIISIKMSVIILNGFERI